VDCGLSITLKGLDAEVALVVYQDEVLWVAFQALGV
jgi:hypothetical protein